MPDNFPKSPAELRTLIERVRRSRDELQHKDTLERIIKAVQKELGDDFPEPAIANGMIMAAGYMEIKALHGLANHNQVRQTFLKGAMVYGCQCPKCSKARAEAKASADDMLRKATEK